MRRLKSDGGRPRIRHDQAAADVHGRLRERAFDVPPPSGADPFSPQERARDSFYSLPRADKGTIQLWIAGNLEPAEARVGDGPDSPPRNVVYTRDIVPRLNADTGKAYTAQQLNGGLQFVLFGRIGRYSTATNWAIPATWKE